MGNMPSLTLALKGHYLRSTILAPILKSGAPFNHSILFLTPVHEEELKVLFIPMQFSSPWYGTYFLGISSFSEEKGNSWD